MRKSIHPEYRQVVIQDSSTGEGFLTRSTAPSRQTIEWKDGNEYPLIKVEVSSFSHPIWTGTQRAVDAAGRIEKFRKKYAAR